ncbi:hypothetical protein BS47DRAFT_1365745 [Hydnum rufescens UP504]|uniref:Uncharacterized protein n=1 Tax=Hydnum rufescens UP504 TaxID=1448309 RepID=A0A9P6ANL0_9AGAM|nr:hypothetical protein BS47DRAFT_1365745 [Hydnum rufescens UP504]
MKIPNHPKSNTFVNNILLGVDDPKTGISRGLGQFIMWCSVVGLCVVTLHCTLDYNTTSLAFHIPDEDSECILKTLVGNHKNHNKKGICTTLVKAAFRNEVASSWLVPKFP